MTIAEANKWFMDGVQELKVMGSHVPAGMLANLLPPAALTDPSRLQNGQQPEETALRYMPGILPNAYKQVHDLGQLVNSLSDNKYGWSVPGADRAGQLYDQSIAAGKQHSPITPVAPDPTSQGQLLAADLGLSLGSVITPIPGVSKLPLAVKGVLANYAPGAVMPKTAAVAAPAMGLIQDAVLPDEVNPHKQEAEAARAKLASQQIVDVPPATAGVMPAEVEAATPQVNAQPGAMPAVTEAVTPVPTVSDIYDVPPQVPAQSDIYNVPPQGDGVVAPTQAGVALPGSVADHTAKVTRYAQEFGVDPALAVAVMMQESGGVNGKTSPSGAQGLMQLMPDTARALGVTNTWDPDQNLRAGVAYLAEGIDKTGTLKGTASYYHGGPNTAIWGPNTAAYANAVAGRYYQTAQAQPVVDPTPIHDVKPPEGWTWGQIAGFTATTITLTGMGGMAGRAVRGITGRTKEAMYAHDNNAYAADKAARLAGNIPNEVDANVPNAPVAGRSATTTFLRGIADNNAELDAYIEFTSRGLPDLGASLRATTGLSNNNIWRDSKIRNFQETGYDKTFGMHRRSDVDHYNDVMRLTPEQQRQYNIARWVDDELDNRANKERAARKEPIYKELTDENWRVNLRDHHSDELRALTNKAKSDPVVKALLEQKRAMTSRDMEIRQAHGLISAAERVKLQNSHPSYMPSGDYEGRVTKAFGQREMQTFSGIDKINVNAIDLDKQHTALLYGEILDNQWKAAFFKHAWSHQAKSGNQLFERHLGPPKSFHAGEWIEEKARNRIVDYYVNGEHRYVKVNDPVAYTWFSQTVDSAGAMMKIASASRNMLQSGVTGPLAMISGTFFGLTQFARSIPEIAVLRHKGLSTSPLDAAANWATGGRVGIRGDLAGTALMQSVTLGMDAAALGSKVIGEMMRKNNPAWANQALRHLFGDQAVDNFSTRAQVAFSNSVYAEQLAGGYRNASGYGVRELTVGVGKVPIPGIPDKINPLAKIYNPMDAVVDHKLTDIPVLRQGQAGALHVMDLAKAIHGLLSDAGQSSLYRINTGRMPLMKWAKANMPEEVIGYKVRDVMGDPGRKAGNATVRGLAELVPWGNVAIQSNRRVVQAFIDNPVGVAVGATTAMMQYAAWSMLSAMHHDETTGTNDAVNFLQNELSNRQQGAEVTIFSAGSPVESNTRISLSQPMRLIYPFALQLFGDVLQVFTAYNDPDAKMTAMDTLSMLLGTHVKANTTEAFREGLSSQISPVTPPLGQAITALTGRQFTPDFARLFSPTNSATPLVDKLSRNSMVGDPGAPNHVKDTDTVTHTAEAEIAKTMIGAVGGHVGAFATSIFEGIGEGLKWGKSGPEIVGNLLEMWKQGAMDKTPMLNNVVWQTDMRLGKSTPLAEVTMNKFNAMKPMATYMADAEGAGRTRAEGMPLPSGDMGTKLPTDPVMQGMYRLIGDSVKILQERYMPIIGDYSKLMHDNEHGPASPYAKREAHNDLIRKYNNQMALIATHITNTEEMLTRMTGKHIQVERIDWTKGLSQFD